MNLELLLAGATLVNRTTEAIKRVPLFARVSENWRDLVLLVISAVEGIIFAAVVSQNLFASIPDVRPEIGIAMTGIIVAAGSNAIHFTIDLFNRRNPDTIGQAAKPVAPAPVIASNVSYPDAA